MFEIKGYGAWKMAKYGPACFATLYYVSMKTVDSSGKDLMQGGPSAG
jgi:hypothetical protein